jgi:hypothetical protein
MKKKLIKCGTCGFVYILGRLHVCAPQPAQRGEIPTVQHEMKNFICPALYGNSCLCGAMKPIANTHEGWEKVFDELWERESGVAMPEITKPFKAFIYSLLSAQAIELTREHVGIAHEMKKARNMPGMDGGEYDQALDDFIKTIAKKYD